MTEVVVGNAQQDNNSNAEVNQISTSAGQLLRQAREAKQMSVESLASALKLPVHKLQALEEDRWDQLTDSVFTRSLALSVCRVLRIPSEPVLALLPKLQGAKLSTNPEGINAPFKEKSLRSIMAPSQETTSGKALKVALALLIAIVGGAGLYFLPQWQSSEDANVDAQVASQVAEAANTQELLLVPSQTAPVVAASPAANDAVSTSTTTSAPAMLEPALKDVDAAVQPSVAATPVAETAAPSAPASVVEAATKQPEAAVTDSAVLRFTATGESWIQVKDAKQRVVMEKILKAGDVYEETVAGRPLQMVVGNTSVTKLEIDGVAWDLAASAKNNVARFEVK